MYAPFTDRARKVMQLANKEAQRFNHDYIGTEHILLGLIAEGSGVAVNVLKNLGVEPRQVILAVEKFITGGSRTGDAAPFPRTPRAKKLIEHSMEEARSLKHDYIGTEHILLGMLHDDVGLAAVVLMNLGLQLNGVRAEIEATLQRAEKDQQNAFSPQSRFPWRKGDPQSLVRQPDDATKRRLWELAQAIAPLQEAKENAVESQDFVQAARLRDEQDQRWRELQGLNLPEWVLKNVKRVVDAQTTKASRFPLLDMLHDEAGEPDPNVLSVLPKPLMPPVKFVVGTIPRFPVSTLKALLDFDDIGAPYFQALVPLISPESLARARKDHNIVVRMAFMEIDRGLTTHGCPAMVCVVRPTLLSQEVRGELFAGLHRTNCAFVVFEASEEVHSLLSSLPPGTRLLEQ